MPFPSPKRDVPRASVPDEVKRMLRNADVGDVDCVEQPDLLYTVTPHPRGALVPAGPAGATRRKTKKKVAKKKARTSSSALTKKKTTKKKKKAG